MATPNNRDLSMIDPTSLDGVEGCYLLHFNEPVGHAEHYLGWALDMGRRIREHQKGTSGARIPTAASNRGIGFVVARVWIGATRGDEMRLHGKSRRPPSPAMRKQHEHGRGRGTKKHCPICRERRKNA